MPCGDGSVDVKGIELNTEKCLKIRCFRESEFVARQVPVPGFFHFTGKWKMVCSEKRWRVVGVDVVELTAWLKGKRKVYLYGYRSDVF